MAWLGHMKVSQRNPLMTETTRCLLAQKPPQSPSQRLQSISPAFQRNSLSLSSARFSMNLGPPADQCNQLPIARSLQWVRSLLMLGSRHFQQCWRLLLMMPVVAWARSRSTGMKLWKRNRVFLVRISWTQCLNVVCTTTWKCLYWV